VELALGSLWAVQAWRFVGLVTGPESCFSIDSQSVCRLGLIHVSIYNDAAVAVGMCVFLWLLVALALLDAENLWLPDRITLPGIAIGTVYYIAYHGLGSRHTNFVSVSAAVATLDCVISSIGSAILAAALLVLLIRWIYWLIRRREGIGLGDAKLMAMLAAWLGLRGALLSFALGVVLGSLTALVLLGIPSTRSSETRWTARKLPLGTFLCIGGIISALWGQPILATYFRWAGF
jgi:leader peptidase (prepilin peptidase)/N-methyltransferase